MSPPSQPAQATGPIMIVDDDPTLRDFMCVALGEQGYRTISAANGMKALAMLEPELPALILVDVGMPGLNGREFAARVHALWDGQIPCVIMSGSRPSEEELADEAVTGYLPKPFDLEDLFRVVHELARPAEISTPS